MITVVIPVWDRAHLVGKAVASVLAQTHRDFELIVVDDGSTDGSLEAAKAAAAGDPRVSFLQIEHTGNPSIVKDTGVRAGSGEWVAVLDSDDTLLQTALAESLQALALHPESGVLYTDRFNVSPDGTRCPDPANGIRYSRDRVLSYGIIFHLVVFRRDLYELVGGFDPSLDYADDYDLNLKLSEVTEVFHLQRPLHLRLVGPGHSSVSESFRVEQIESVKRAQANAIRRRRTFSRFT
jgi:glycosyltransferase involved in cell wall biosynthesis